MGATATGCWAMSDTLAGQHLPPWHLELEEVMFGHSLYQHKITKRESELAQYIYWRKPDNSAHWTDLVSLQISHKFGLCSSICSSDSVEERATEVGRPQRRPSEVHSAGDCVLPSWRAGFDDLVGLLHPMTPWSYMVMADISSSFPPGVSNCSPALSPGRLSVSAKAAAQYWDLTWNEEGILFLWTENPM